MNLLFRFMLGQPKKIAPPAVVAVKKKVRGARPINFVKGKQKQKARYEAMVKELTAEYDIRVKRWRKNTSGVAWLMRARNGTVTRWLESPYPTGPVSCAVFLHEVGHHAIGFNVYKPRCLEEHKAWEWALKTMREREMNITPSVEKRVRQSMQYAVSKAVRRGLKRLPVELEQYL